MIHKAIQLLQDCLDCIVVPLSTFPKSEKMEVLAFQVDLPGRQMGRRVLRSVYSGTKAVHCESNMVPFSLHKGQADLCYAYEISDLLMAM